MIGGTEYDKKVTVLAGGYLGRGSAIGWTGNILVLPETYAYAQLLAASVKLYRLAVVLYKIIPLPEGGFRVDP
jgi:hypothetical protein